VPYFGFVLLSAPASRGLDRRPIGPLDTGLGTQSRGRNIIILSAEQHGASTLPAGSFYNRSKKKQSDSSLCRYGKPVTRIP
jgi:hypothetical protein